MWLGLVKIQYTELKLSCRNDLVVKNSIYSNGDLDLWPNDPKINGILPLPAGNHVYKFGKYPIYRTKVIVRKPMWTPAACHAQSHNTSVSIRAYEKDHWLNIFMFCKLQHGKIEIIWYLQISKACQVVEFLDWCNLIRIQMTANIKSVLKQWQFETQ
jgi:hypothetical protein